MNQWDSSERKQRCTKVKWYTQHWYGSCLSLQNLSFLIFGLLPLCSLFVNIFFFDCCPHVFISWTWSWFYKKFWSRMDWFVFFHFPSSLRFRFWFQSSLAALRVKSITVNGILNNGVFSNQSSFHPHLSVSLIKHFFSVAQLFSKVKVNDVDLKITVSRFEQMALNDGNVLASTCIG